MSQAALLPSKPLRRRRAVNTAARPAKQQPRHEDKRAVGVAGGRVLAAVLGERRGCDARVSKHTEQEPCAHYTPFAHKN